MTDRLGELGELGGFFALADPGGTDAVPWAEMLSEEPLSLRLAQVRAALASSTGQATDAVDPKVAMSALQIGLASRLWSVGVASAMFHSWVPDLGPANLLGSPIHRGTVPLALADGERGYAVSDVSGAAARLVEVVVRGSLADLDAACARVGRVSPQVLRSNSASSLVGAARVLARARPRSGPAAWELARTLLEDPALRTGGRRRARAELPDGVGGAMEEPREAFMRIGCCLFDRIPGHGLCPDCVRAERQPHLVTPGH